MNFNVDVLIIGGGPQGFWILEQLQKEGYCCQLWECHHAGAGQAAHAEWYLHRGHLLLEEKGKNPSPFFPYLNGSAQQWESRFHETLARERVPSYVGFLPDEIDYRVTDTWTARNLNYIADDPQRLGLRSDYEFLYRTAETCVDPAPIFNDFLDVHSELTVAIQGEIRVRRDNAGRISEVTADGVGEGNEICVTPKLVILAAGSRNGSLLEEVFATQPIPEGGFQINTHGLLLVLRDPRNRLPGETVFDWKTKLFIVARPSSEDTPRLWIVGSKGTWKSAGQPGFTEGELKERIKNVWEDLSSASLLVDSLHTELEFAICTGVLASQNYLQQMRNVHSCASPANLIAVWPQRLTLSPHWASEVLAAVQNKLGNEKSAECRIPDRHPKKFRQVWEDSYLSWEQFRGKYLV